MNRREMLRDKLTDFAHLIERSSRQGTPFMPEIDENVYDEIKETINDLVDLIDPKEPRQPTTDELFEYGR